MRRRAALLLLAATASPATAASWWQVDPAASQLTFTATQAGARFTGRFTRFDAAIAFDAYDLPGSRFEVRIDTASAHSHDEQRDELLRGPDFFWSDAHPQAVFVAGTFTADGAGWTAAGTLTLRGVTRRVPVRFHFSRLPDGGARLEGSARLRRLEFGVGEGQWAETKWVGDAVDVRFDLRLEPAAAPATVPE